MSIFLKLPNWTCFSFWCENWRRKSGCSSREASAGDERHGGGTAAAPHGRYMSKSAELTERWQAPLCWPSTAASLTADSSALPSIQKALPFPGSLAVTFPLSAAPKRNSFNPCSFHQNFHQTSFFFNIFDHQQTQMFCWSEPSSGRALTEGSLFIV